MSRNPYPMGELPDRTERWAEVNPSNEKAALKTSWRNTVNFLNQPFIAGISSVQILQANLARIYLLIQNNSVGTMYVVFNNSANIFNGVQIPSGGNYEPFIAPYSGVYILGSAVNLNGVAIEGVRTYAVNHPG